MTPYLDLDIYADPLWFLAVLAGVIGVVWALARRRSRVRLSVAHALVGVGASIRQRVAWLPWLVRLVAVALLAAAAARPQLHTGETRTTTNGVAIEIVVDRSSSMAHRMRAGDEVTNRLEVVKRVVQEFVEGDDATFEGRPNDLIGLVTFAGQANTICPLTHDHEILADLASRTRLADADTSEDGTAIGDAIALAAARLRDAEQRLEQRNARTPVDTAEFNLKSKAIVLLTDGRQNRGQTAPDDAARLAKQWDIKIYTIAIGGEQRGFFSRAAGADRRLLSAIAEFTGGRFFDAADADALRDVYEAIDELETTEIETLEYDEAEELYEPLAAWGTAALGAFLLLSTTLFRRARS